MKNVTIPALFATVLSMNVNAAEAPFELLAGVEAGIDSDTTMLVVDLNKTQEVLSSQPTGAKESWYNIDTTTHFDIVVGKHYSSMQRPCVSYNLTVKHSSNTEKQVLNACLNYSGRWISTTI